MMKNWKTTAGGIVSLVMVLGYILASALGLDVDVDLIHGAKGNFLLLAAVASGAVSNLLSKDHDK